jgi:protein-disulfide isomerase
VEDVKTSSSRKIGVAAGIGTAIVIAALFSLWYVGQGSFPTQEAKPEFGQIIGTVRESTPLQTSTPKKFAGSVNFDIPEFAKYRGSDKAQINLVEFGDYQCPFCKRFFDQTEPQLMQEYIDSGKTKFYFLDVSIVGEDSLVLGQGSWCADEQGKYWEYHDYMYANQGDENSGWGTPEKVKFMVRNISGLDTDKFNQCLDSKKYELRSKQLTAFSQQIGLVGTPTMFVGTPESGYIKITGAQPYEVYKKVIDAHLE